jgi:hypothetical protein
MQAYPYNSEAACSTADNICSRKVDSPNQKEIDPSSKLALEPLCSFQYVPPEDLTVDEKHASRSDNNVFLVRRSWDW